MPKYPFDVILKVAPAVVIEFDGVHVPDIELLEVIDGVKDPCQFNTSFASNKPVNCDCKLVSVSRKKLYDDIT